MRSPERKFAMLRTCMTKTPVKPSCPLILLMDNGNNLVIIIYK